MLWQTSRRALTVGSRPLVMGILNVTPDSFSDGGKFYSVAAAVDRAKQMADEGADLIDVGGESTRPQAVPVSAEEESRRILPVLEKILSLGLPISIDTTKAIVAERALQAGAEIINDVSGGEWDPHLWPVIAREKAGYVLMHCQGTPATMQLAPHYENIVPEVQDYLRRRLTLAAIAGITPDRVAVDPGFGFGKTVEHNMQLLRGLADLKSLQRPILVGLSRKSFLKKIGAASDLEVNTLGAEIWAAIQGARLWRVHEVKVARAAAHLLESLCLE